MKTYGYMVLFSYRHEGAIGLPSKCFVRVCSKRKRLELSTIERIAQELWQAYVLAKNALRDEFYHGRGIEAFLPIQINSKDVVGCKKHIPDDKPFVAYFDGIELIPGQGDITPCAEWPMWSD